MHRKLVPMVLLIVGLVSVVALPAAAAPPSQVSVTHYVLIDATNPQPAVVFSTVSGVQVTRLGPTSLELTLPRTFRFLVGTAYGICSLPNSGWDCAESPQLLFVLRDQPNPRKWLLYLDEAGAMVSLILKP